MLPGFRLLDDGCILHDGPILTADHDPPWLARLDKDGRTFRSKIQAGDDLVRRIETGWRPSQADLQDAPLIDHWVPMITNGGAVLLGEIVHHPLLGEGSKKATSLLLALDAQLIWARTLSRFYTLGRPLGCEDHS